MRRCGPVGVWPRNGRSTAQGDRDQLRAALTQSLTLKCLRARSPGGHKQRLRTAAGQRRVRHSIPHHTETGRLSILPRIPSTEATAARGPDVRARCVKWQRIRMSWNATKAQPHNNAKVTVIPPGSPFPSRAPSVAPSPYEPSSTWAPHSCPVGESRSVHACLRPGEAHSPSNVAGGACPASPP